MVVSQYVIEILSMWRFTSGLDLASLVVNSDLLQISCNAIKALQTETDASLRCKLDKQSNYTLLAFTTSLSRKEIDQQGGDLVSSVTLNDQDFHLFDFLCSQSNQSFSIDRDAITLFKAHLEELSQLKTQIQNSKTRELLLSTPLIITGHCLGGSVASLFTLWLLENINQPLQKYQPPPKLPICITFGSPFIGNLGFKQAVLERSKWNSCFLHVVGNKDLFPRTSISLNNTAQSVTDEYKAFGAFILCSAKGCAFVNDLEMVPRLLENTEGQVSGQALGIDYYAGIVNDLKTKVIVRRNSQLDLSDTDPLRTGIILQLEAMGVEMTIQEKQQNHDNNNLISSLEEREKVLMAERMMTMDPSKKLNQIKIKMAHLEWYKKVCKTEEIGYYDCYKNQFSMRDREVTRLKKILNNYWKHLVEEAERKPQKEGAFIGMGWLYAGTNYRRMVEPLDIAEYYRKNGKGDYHTRGRSRHYLLLEQWQKEEAEKLSSTPNNKKKQDVAGILTEDSCFWAKVEEALISCKLLKAGTSSAVEKQSAKESLNMFEQYAMDQINNYGVSPEIFLKQSSFMKWWKEFQGIIEASHNSPLFNFMKNCRYLQYDKGSTLPVC